MRQKKEVAVKRYSRANRTTATAIFCLALLSVLIGAPVSTASAQTSCQFQNPFFDGQDYSSHITAAGYLDTQYPGLHNVVSGGWPGVDTIGQQRSPFTNGGYVAFSGWDSIGGGWGVKIEGVGDCQGWLYAVWHMSEDPSSRLPVGSTIDGNTILGQQGTSGFYTDQNGNIISGNPAWDAHNHGSLGYTQDLGYPGQSVDGYFWIHPQRVLGGVPNTANLPTSVDEEFILDTPILQSIQPQAVNWAPQNDIAKTNSDCPAMVTGAIEASYPLGVTIHHTVGNGGGDWFKASVGAHCGESRVPYLVVIDQDGIAHQTAEFGSITYHARCDNPGVEGGCPNTDYVSVSVVGNYMNETLSAQQEQALINVIQWFVQNGAANKVLGHRDVGKLNGYGTLCPGNNIYDLIPEIIAKANVQGQASGSNFVLEGEFIIDSGEVIVEEYDVELMGQTTIQKEQPQVTQPILSPKNTNFTAILIILAIVIIGLFFVGGVMIILSVSNKKRPSTAFTVLVIWIFLCVVLWTVGSYIYKSPQSTMASEPILIPVPSSTPVILTPTPGGEFVGTGGEIVKDMVWENAALEIELGEQAKNPIIVRDSTNPLSPVFWYFAVGQKWGNDIPVWANNVSLDPNLLATFILIESGGNPYAHCPQDILGFYAPNDGKKDKGLYQLNPAYFNGGCDLDSNIAQGTQYIKTRLDAAGGNLAAAAAGYNGGPKALEWFLASADPSSDVYKQKRAEYITFLNGLGYDGASKANIVERYVGLITGVYAASLNNSTVGLEPFLAPGSYAGKVAKAYGLPWPPVIPSP